MKKIREAQARVVQVEEARERLRGIARASMGFAGTEEAAPVHQSLRGTGAGLYPLVALGLLVIVDQFQGFGFFVLGPEISRALGISPATLAAMNALKGLAIAAAALPMAAFVQKVARRAVLSIVTGFGWAITTLFTGLVTNSPGMLGVLLADGVSSGSVGAIHQPFLVDTYPPSVRVRVLSSYQAMIHLGSVLSPLLVAVLTAQLAFTWRGVFVVMGFGCLFASLFSLRLRDPGFGKLDAREVRRAVREEEGEAAESIEEEQVQLGFFENVRRLLTIQTVRRLYAAFAVFGMLLIPLQTYLFFFLDLKWNMGPGARGLFLAGMSAFSVACLILFGRRGEALFRIDPANFPRVASLLLGLGIVALAMALFVPVFVVMVALFAAAFALFAILNPMVVATLLSIVPARARPHAAALAGIFQFGVGAFLGLLLLGGIDRRFGVTGALLAITLPGVAAAFVLRTASRTVNADLDRHLDDLVEEEELRRLASSGQHLPLLTCRKVDYAYGAVQVLFDVDFAVDDGEMVGLLGTNGAGKSTLLKAISGVGLPMGGSIRLGGADITYLDAERRLKLGISQIPGGRAVFGPLSVVENLRAFAFTRRKDRRWVDSAIETCFEVFPQLASRRNQRAQTLSGGEQQMLGLSRAFILKPRLLLIDELSLGLAPALVSRLLEMVQRVNKEGSAVVLVEQSVNVCLSVVDHVYFMEKGEIRFDGTARELLARRDLLRAVFLQGAGKALKVR